MAASGISAFVDVCREDIKSWIHAHAVGGCKGDYRHKNKGGGGGGGSHRALIKLKVATQPASTFKSDHCACIMGDSVLLLS